MCLNIRSISNKFDMFKQLIKSTKENFQIIGLTETWLGDENYKNFNLEGYDFISMHRSGKKGGGVGIYVAEKLQHKLRKDLNVNIEDTIESTFIEIATEIGKNIIIGVIYRPPNNKIEVFQDAINEFLSKVDKENKICYLMGDFNIDLLKSESCDFANKFTEQLFTSSFYPLITKPTRITSHTATLIDNIFTNNINKIDSSINGIIFSDISDHLPIIHKHFLNTLRPNEDTGEKYYTKRIYNKNNSRLFTDEIKNVCWEETISCNNSNESFNQFSTLFTASYDKHFPIKRMKVNKKINKHKSPWMTKCVLKSIKRKNKLYSKYLSDPNKINENLYKKYKNRLNHVIRLSKKKYYEQELITYKHDSKMMWKTINEILSRKTKKKRTSKRIY